MPDFTVSGRRGAAGGPAGRRRRGAASPRAVDLRDGDVLVVTSKLLSKAEGRLVPVPPGARPRAGAPAGGRGRDGARRRPPRADDDRADARTGWCWPRPGSTPATCAPTRSRCCRSTPTPRRGRCASACTRSPAPGSPWSSATRWAGPGGSGRSTRRSAPPGWRPVRDSRGTTDSHGHVLEVTEIAVADELASAAELVKGKADGVPVALVRGLALPDDGRGAAALVRPPEQDWFRLGTREAQAGTLALRRTVRAFTAGAGRPGGRAAGGRGRPHRARAPPHGALAVRARGAAPRGPARRDGRAVGRRPAGGRVRRRRGRPAAAARRRAARGAVPRRALPGP